jgi:hypothetical protein
VRSDASGWATPVVAVGTLVAILALVAFAFVSCGDSRLSEAQLVGRWTVDDTAGRQSVVFAPDHTYTQTVVDRRGQTHSGRGTWTLDNSNGRTSSEIVMRNAVLFDTFARTVPAWSRGDLTLFAQRTWGQVNLAYGDPDNLGFTKQ